MGGFQGWTGYAGGVSNALSPTWKDGLKDIFLGGLGAATTIGLQSLQSKLGGSGQPSVVYAQSGAGSYQVPAVSAPGPLIDPATMRLAVYAVAAVLLVKAFKG